MSDRDERWRLVLGAPAEEALGSPSPGACAGMDQALAALYEGGERKGGLGASNPRVARWLGDIRTHFPPNVVSVLQQDAVDRLGLRQLLLEPELLGQIEPDIHLVTTLLSLSRTMPESTKQAARQLVKRLVDDLMKKLASAVKASVRGALARAHRTRRPRPSDIDWGQTIRENLRNWQPDRRQLIVDRLVGHPRKTGALQDVIVCVDQSGSMATSVLYASLFSAVLASIPAVRMRMSVFDTALVDLTDLLADPVDVLFGTQLGGGTDIDRALAWCQQQVVRPAKTTLVLITDLYEGGNRDSMIARAAELVASGVNVITLLALSDEGRPAYDSANAAAFAGMGIPCFGCTPDRFAGLMAVALRRGDVAGWAGREGLVVVG